MRISESCAKCLYDRQKNKTDNEAYLSEIRELLDNRKETDTSPLGTEEKYGILMEEKHGE